MPARARTSVLAIVACVALAISGCTTGAFYHRVTLPLDVNFNNTPVHPPASRGSTKEFRYYVDVQWDSNGIGDIARKAGLSKVYYADRTVLSIAGVWTQVFVTVYGE
tara:strand:+ start:1842 stop:2162 length:321 start_codon:yes stop_codon:yes gene_type:complete